jgi:hypothetical protein
MKLKFHPRDPMVTDRWFDIAFIANWVVYCFWGVAIFIQGLPTFDITTPYWYPQAWAGAIGVLSGVAALSALSMFVQTPRLTDLWKKKIELGSLTALGAFISIYPITLIGLAISGDKGRIAIAVLSLSYLIFPLLRIHLLRRALRMYEKTEQETR